MSIFEIWFSIFQTSKYDLKFGSFAKHFFLENSAVNMEYKIYLPIIYCKITLNRNDSLKCHRFLLCWMNSLSANF